ncbi:MAG: LacI family transcriptional regulator [Cytophagaceae bacterium]|nr:LacI family transcriptional regulator [Cytophagaceae bacterium]
MKRHPVTIKDIARQLNVSVATVSRALRGLPDIHPDTRQAVLTLAQEWDYQPNQLATSLVKSRTRTIGIIAPNLGYYFFSTAVHGIEEVAYAAGYSVLLTQSKESYQRELTNLQDLARGQVDGLIVSISRETSDYEHFTKLQRRGVPLVLFDRDCEALDVSKVLIDNHAAAYEATDHLLTNGCRRVALLAGPAYLSLTSQRRRGYLDALAAHGLPADESLVAYGDYSQTNAVELTHRLMSLPNPPDGLLALSDRIAVGALIALKERGVRLPDEVALVGFNNEPLNALLTPSLTSVAQPAEEIGREAARLLIAQLESPQPVPPVVLILPTYLVVRESSQKTVSVGLRA